MVLALGAVQSFGAAYLTSHNGCIDARDPSLAAANMSSHQTLVIIPPDMPTAFADACGATSDSVCKDSVLSECVM